MIQTSIERRIDVLRAQRVAARRQIDRAQFNIADYLDRREHIEAHRNFLRGSQREWEELHAMAGKALPGAVRVALLPSAQRRMPAVKAAGIRRAGASLVLKSVDAELREIVGIASTPEVDRLGDQVVAEGAMFRLPLPLLHQHAHDRPVGTVVDAAVTKAGISITARLAKVLEPGPLKERVDTAWQEVKSGLVRGLSIGFQPLEFEPLASGTGLRFTKWLLLEVSLVSVGANASAAIQLVRAA